MIDNFNLVLLSGGHHVCDPSWAKAATGIDRCYKVYLPVSGEGQLNMEDGAHTLRAGRIYLIRGHSLVSQDCPDRMEVYWMHFSPESLYLRYLLDQLPPVCEGSSPAADRMTELYGEICELFKPSPNRLPGRRLDSSPASDCRIHGWLLDLIGRLLQASDPDAVRKFNPEYYRLKKALDYMQRHFRENPPLSAIARQAALAPNYFHRRFLGVFGMTPHAYMLSQRMNHARRLLASTDDDIKGIALSVGYDDPAYFTRVFTREVRITPTAYRVKRRTGTGG